MVDSTGQQAFEQPGYQAEQSSAMDPQVHAAAAGAAAGWTARRIATAVPQPCSASKAVIETDRQSTAAAASAMVMAAAKQQQQI